MANFRHKIRRAAENRGVGALYHFTLKDNLPSIMENGLLSSKDLADTDIDYWATDDARWDDTPQAISFSIDSINNAMFDAKRNDRRRHWVILEVERKVLWTHSCRFCSRNASSSAMRNFSSFLGGPRGFDSMFEDQEVFVITEKGYRFRRDYYQIPKNLPTWNDAEVQVLQPVHQGLITEVLVGDKKLKAWAAGLTQQFGVDCEVVIDDGLAL